MPSHGRFNVNLLLMAIAIIFFIEGPPHLAFPNALKKIMAEVLQVENKHLRIMGFAAMLTGLALAWPASGSWGQ